jgi:tRNA (uracil-5-)-methyltransferase
MSFLFDPKQYQQQLIEKQHHITQLFSAFSLPEFELFESEPIHYRMRAEFRVWHDGDDLFYIMFDQNTRQKYRVEQFPVACELINQAMSLLLEKIRDNTTLRQKLFQVDFLASQQGELVISLLYHKPLDEEWQQQALILQQHFSRIAPTSFIGRARKQKIIIGRDFVNETLTVDGKPFYYQQIENSFTQPNAGVNEKMLSWARQVCEPLQGDLIELYCGNGNFSIALAEQFDRVLATEISKSSVQSAQYNIAANQLDNVNIIRMSSEEFSQAMAGERQFRRLESLDLSTYALDTVLVDPPRAGLDPDSVKLVSQFKHIIYISCNPETLKNNLEQLTKTHDIQRFALFDQFPYTHHIECGVFLTRKLYQE